jgi:hypothetical protein
MPPKLWTVFHQFKPLSTARFFDDTVIASTGLGAFKPNIFAHKAPRREKKTACPPGRAGSLGYLRKKLLQDLRHNA